MLMKNSSAEKEMEGECHYGDGEEVEEGKCAGQRRGRGGSWDVIA